MEKNGGFCQASGVYYSNRQASSIPQDPNLDITKFLLAKKIYFHEEEEIAFADAETGLEMTMLELKQHAFALARLLHREGVRRGDIVLVMVPNCLVFPPLTLAIMAAGAAFTPANPQHTHMEIAQQIRDSSPVVVVTIPELKYKFDNILVKILAVSPTLLSRTGEEKHEYSGGSEDQKAVFGDHALIMNPNRQNDAATLQYSSGTTGKSKGVVSSHGNLIAMSCMLQTLMKKQEVYLCYVPLYHMYGFSVFILGALAVGAKVVILPKYSVEGLLQAIEKYRVTHLPAVPTTAVALCRCPYDVLCRYELGSLREVIFSGAAMSRALMEKFAGLFPGVQLLQAYGLTEVSGPVLWSDGSDPSNYGSAGILLPHVEAKILDLDTAQAVGPGEKGELCIRGPMLMQGYLHRSDATCEVIDEQGWFHTGDVCLFNWQGRVYVVDRLKEMIKYKSFQVSPAELEEILMHCPLVADCAVVKYPDEEAGEIPMAFIVKKPGKYVTADQVMLFVTKKVASYKKIRKVAFVRSIPRTASGKVLRRLLLGERARTSNPNYKLSNVSRL